MIDVIFFNTLKYNVMSGPIIKAMIIDPSPIVPNPTPAKTPNKIPNIMANPSIPQRTYKNVLTLNNFMKTNVSSSYTIEGYPVEIINAKPRGNNKLPNRYDRIYNPVVLIIIFEKITKSHISIDNAMLKIGMSVMRYLNDLLAIIIKSNIVKLVIKLAVPNVMFNNKL